jgi:5-methylcytosine-specific restriction protein A
MPRAHHFSRKIIKQAKERASGKCENRICGAALKVGGGEADHILPVEMGGESILANCQILCDVCHKAKTKKDVRRIRQSDRQRDKHTGAFQQAKRHTGLRARHKQNSATRPIEKWKGF